MADETTFCPDCAGERGGFSTGTEKCQRHKTDDIISTLTQDLAISRRACEESGLAYETLADEVAALRAALGSATRGVATLTTERNAALTLAEQRGAAYDMTWREVESLREWKDKLEGEKAPPPADAAGYIDVVFDGPPEHVSGRFVEVENERGASIRVGEWVHRPDGYWALRIPRVPPPVDAATEACPKCHGNHRDESKHGWTPTCADAPPAPVASEAVLPLEAPECNDGDDCCRYCGRGLQPCGACKPAPPADAAPRFRADLPAILPQRFAKTPEAAREAPPADAVAEDVEPRHELKTWPEPFAAVLDGRKRFEIRKADRPYTDGDVLLLREWDPKAEEFNGAYTGRSIKVKVTYRVRPGMWGLSADTCVLGIVPLAPPADAAMESHDGPEWACVNCGHVGPEGFTTVTYDTPGEPVDYDVQCSECGSCEVEETAALALSRVIREHGSKDDAPPEVREAAEEGRVVVTATRRVGDKDTMSFDGTTFTTVRPCRDCGVLICGGPTLCLYCAAKLSAPAPEAKP